MYGGFLGAFDGDILDIKDRVFAFIRGFHSNSNPSSDGKYLLLCYVLKSITSPITIPKIGKWKCEFKEMRDGRLNERINSLHKVEGRI